MPLKFFKAVLNSFYVMWNSWAPKVLKLTLRTLFVFHLLT